MMTLGTIAGLPMTLSVATLEVLPLYLGALGVTAVIALGCLVVRAAIEDRRAARQRPPAEVAQAARLLSTAA